MSPCPRCSRSWCNGCCSYFAPTSAVRLLPNAPDAGLGARPNSDWAEGRAAKEIAQARQHWGDRLPGDPQRLLPWLMDLNDADRMDLLALCVALAVNDVRDSERRSPLDGLCRLLALDMAQWWEATAKGYFSRLTKEAIAQAIEQGAGAEVAARFKGVSKGELARIAERELHGKGWLPAPLKGPAQGDDCDVSSAE